MRKLSIAMALASTALATPAVARDQSWYVGVEGGVLLVQDGSFDYTDTTGQRAAVTYPNAITLDHNLGEDVDLIGGYDFGRVRAELELGWKNASIDHGQFSQTFLANNITPTAVIGGQTVALPYTVEFGGRVKVLSAMANLLPKCRKLS